MLGLPVCLAFAWLASTAAADWPQFQCNAARTGWTPDSPAPPYGAVYKLWFQPESLGLVQPVVSGDVMYIPTRQGRLYAFDPATGNRLRVSEGLGTVIRTPACAGGKIVLSNLEGEIIAADAATGQRAWTVDTGFGVSAATCVADGRVFLGNRRGEMFCLGLDDGHILWRQPLPFFIWSAAAVADGKVYVATDGEIHLFCLSADTGEVLWHSPQLPGRYVRDWCPVAHAGKVFVNTMPSSQVPPDIGPLVMWGPKEEVVKQFEAPLARGEMPAEFIAAAEKTAEWLETSPVDQTMFAFDARTGQAPYTVGTYRSLAGWGVAAPPPAVDADGMLQVTVSYRSFSFARLDPATGRYGQVLGVQGTNGDENHASTCGGHRVFWTHYAIGNCDASVMYDLKTHESCYIPGDVAPLPADADKQVSIVRDHSPESVYYRTGLTDEGSLANAYTGSAIWKDMLFHNQGEEHFVLAFKGYDGAETQQEATRRSYREKRK